MVFIINYPPIVPEETGSTAFLRFSVLNLTNIEEIVNDTLSPELVILELTQAVSQSPNCHIH